MTTETVGAAKLGMTEEEIEAAADVPVELICTECDANMVAELKPTTDFAKLQVRHNCLGFDVVFNPGALARLSGRPEGLKLGGTVAQLQDTYGTVLWQFNGGIPIAVNGIAIDGDIGRIIFRISESNQSQIDAFMVWRIDGRGC